MLFLLLATVPVSIAAAAPSRPPVEGEIADEREEIRTILEYHALVGRLSALPFGLPDHDFDDPTNLTLRQRRSFRQLYPDTPAEGKYQYPRWAFELMNKLEANGRFVLDGRVVDAAEVPYVEIPGGIVLPAAVFVSNNVNASANSQVESETYLAVDRSDPRYLVGGSNSMTVNPQQMYRSSDWGATWVRSQFPVDCGVHSDPWTGFDHLGNAYATTLDYSGGACTGQNTEIPIRRSTDHGVTWSTSHVISYNKGNDKQLNTIDVHPSSPCLGYHYMGWDSSNSEYVGSAPAWNGPWTVVTGKDTASIGTDIATGPSGEAYSVWAKYVGTAGQIRFTKSTNCGGAWSTTATIASTACGYDYGIPAQCNRRVLIYPSVDVDRSGGPRNGWVYVVWNDFSAANSTCIAASDTNNASVWFSRSTDGGTSWSPKAVVHPDPARTDQFNQWMRVDDADGTIWISWHDTKDDVNRVKTHIYLTRSTDGGTTFETPTRVSTEQTDESVGANSGQYGDYEGLTVHAGVAYPFWTDRRVSSGTDEEAFSARVCSEPKTVGATTATPLCSGGIDVSWALPSVFWGDAGFGTRKFQLWKDGVLAVDDIAEGTTSLFHSPGDTNPHVYEIRAVNGCTVTAAYVASGPVAEGTGGSPPPAVGDGLRIAGNGPTTLDWSLTPSAGATGYNLYSSPDPAATFPALWTLVSTSTGTSLSTSLGAGDLHLRITATSSCGESN